MKNEFLTIGPFTVYGYGLMIAIGILAGCLTAEYRAGKQKLDSEQIFPMILWCLVGGFFCAKLLFWITEWKSIVQDPGFIMETLSSGFVVFCGIIGGILQRLLYCMITKLVLNIECFFCDISEFRICAQSRGADPDAVVFQRTGFSAFSFVVADRTEQKRRWSGYCLLSDLL